MLRGLRRCLNPIAVDSNRRHAYRHRNGRPGPLWWTAAALRGRWSGTCIQAASAGTNEPTGFSPTFRAGPALVGPVGNRLDPGSGSRVPCCGNGFTILGTSSESRRSSSVSGKSSVAARGSLVTNLGLPFGGLLLTRISALGMLRGPRRRGMLCRDGARRIRGLCGWSCPREHARCHKHARHGLGPVPGPLLRLERARCRCGGDSWRRGRATTALRRPYEWARA